MAGTTINLLVVEDDAALRLSLSHMFAAFGHGVRCAADGFSALSELRIDVPDIILSDLNMPGMSGFEFLSVVRRRFPSIKVIAMSSAFAVDSIPPRGSRRRVLSKRKQSGAFAGDCGRHDDAGGAEFAQTGRHSCAHLGGADWPRLSRRSEHYAHLPGVPQSFSTAVAGYPAPGARNELHLLQ